jgi:hypothetical protein
LLMALVSVALAASALSLNVQGAGGYDECAQRFGVVAVYYRSALQRPIVALFPFSTGPEFEYDSSLA